MSNDETREPANGLDRRELLRLGVGVGGGALVGQVLGARVAAAQSGSGGAVEAQALQYRPDRWREELRYAGVEMKTGPGWKHEATRASGNGAMDATSRRIVEYVHAFSAADLTPQLESAFANTMLDSIAALISGFESEPARICARLARATRGGS